MSPDTPSAPTTRTRFSNTYRNPSNRTVYVYHSPSFYGTAGYWNLHAASFLFDPYFAGGCNPITGICYPANYLNPASMWFGHPVYLSNSCKPKEQPPANDKPEQAPVNVNITNETHLISEEELAASTTTVPLVVNGTTAPPNTTTTLAATTTTT